MALSIRLRPATEADVPEIARVGSAAFEKDEMLGRIFPERLRRAGEPHPQIAWRAARKSARVHDTGSVIMVAVQGEGEAEEMVGYAWWSLPGAASQSEGGVNPADDQTTLQREGLTFPPEMDREAFATVRAGLRSAEQAALGERGPQDCLELEILAVSPDHGRKGIGRTLVQWGLDKAAQDKVDIFIIGTPAGAPLYHACGFQKLHSVDIFGIPYQVFLQTHDGRIARAVETSSS